MNSEKKDSDIYPTGEDVENVMYEKKLAAEAQQPSEQTLDEIFKDSSEAKVEQTPLQKLTRFERLQLLTMWALKYRNSDQGLEVEITDTSMRFAILPANKSGSNWTKPNTRTTKPTKDEILSALTKASLDTSIVVIDNNCDVKLSKFIDTWNTYNDTFRSLGLKWNKDFKGWKFS